MTEFNLIDLGIPGAALLALVLVVKYFLAAQKETQKVFTGVIEDFQTTIKNHITHDCELHEKTNDVLAALKTSNSELLTYLKNQNGNSAYPLKCKECRIYKKRKKS
jgi:hypothetical protein